MLTVGLVATGFAEEKVVEEDVAGDGREAESPVMGQTNPDDTIFKYEKKDRTSLFQVKISGSNRSQEVIDTGTFALETMYGRLFQPVGDLYAGYYFLSGKAESDNRQRFNATLGYFPSGIGGEAKITLRLLNAEVRETLSIGKSYGSTIDYEFEESALEHGVGFSYRKRFKIVIRELALKYAYTYLDGESVDLGRFEFDTPDTWREVQTDAGFGDIDTHEAVVEVAVGTDNIDNPVLKGIRLDLNSGYQHAQYDGYKGSPGVTDTGFSGKVKLRACTPLGLFSGSYQDSQASKAWATSYQLGGLDIYYKDIDYPYAEDEEVVGLGFTVDMHDFDSALDGDCPRFFYPSNNGYANVSQIRHIGWLASDEFTAKPRIIVLYEEVTRVDKHGLPHNVRIDRKRLIVTTDCPQLGVDSVYPPSATGAFGVDGNDITVTMSHLPSNTESVTARFDDACCGDTEVTIDTVVGQTIAVNSVSVRDRVDCYSGTTPPSRSCLAVGSICNPNNNTCCPPATCSYVSPDYRCVVGGGP